MENAIIIEGKPLSAEQAQILLQVLSQTQIQASAATEAIALRLSLERLVSGVDVVKTSVTEE